MASQGLDHPPKEFTGGRSKDRVERYRRGDDVRQRETSSLRGVPRPFLPPEPLDPHPRTMLLMRVSRAMYQRPGSRALLGQIVRLLVADHPAVTGGPTRLNSERWVALEHVQYILAEEEGASLAWVGGGVKGGRESRG